MTDNYSDDTEQCSRLRCDNDATTLKALAPGLDKELMCDECAEQVRKRRSLETETDQ